MMAAFLFGALVYTFLAGHVTCWPFVEHFGCALKTRWITAALLEAAVSVLFWAVALREGPTRRRDLLCAVGIGVGVAYLASGVWWSIAGMIAIGRFYVAFP